MRIIAQKQTGKQKRTKGGEMKTLIVGTLVILASLAMDLPNSPTFPGNPFKMEEANAAIRYINGYTRSNGTYVGGHYRDTSCDGNPYNNANYLGYND